MMAKEERPNCCQLGRSLSLDYGRNLAGKSLTTLDIGMPLIEPSMTTVAAFTKASENSVA
jgi:hypothetical protein